MKRQIQKEHTRQKLIEVAINLLSTDEYQKVTVDSIVQQAGVSKGTFFTYFKSKEDILVHFDLAQVRWTSEKIASAIDENDNVVQYLIEIIVNTALELHTTPKLTINLLHLATVSEKYRIYLDRTFNELKGLLKTTLEHWQHLELIKLDIPPHEIAENVVQIYLGTLMYWSTLQSNQTLSVLMTRALQNYVSGTIFERKRLE